MAVILSPQDRMRLNRAMQNSPQNKRLEEMKARVEAVRRAADEAKQQEIDLFRRWEEADRYAQLLENMKKDNAPTTTGEEWNKTFIFTLKHLPEARSKARELWFQYAAGKEEKAYV